VLVITRRSYRLEDEEGAQEEYPSISVAMNKEGLFEHDASLLINN
jgi:hypothetical protein